MKKLVLFVAIALPISIFANAIPWNPQIPYVLNPLDTRNGNTFTGDIIDNVTAWETNRQYLIDYAKDNAYGREPAPGTYTQVNTITGTASVYSGTVTRKTVNINLTGPNGSYDWDVKVWMPNGNPNLKVFIFNDHRGTSEADEYSSSYFNKDMLLANGYGVAFYDVNDTGPGGGGGDSSESYKTAIHNKFNLNGPNDWGLIATWAFGGLRVLDALDDDTLFPEIAHIGVMGHSRSGHTAEWMAAQDTRLEICISNGATDMFAYTGDTNKDIQDLGWKTFWYCNYFSTYHKHEWPEVPWPEDGNIGIALTAPRLFAQGTGRDDNTVGGKYVVSEYYACVYSQPVWNLYGLLDDTPWVSDEYTETVAVIRQNGNLHYHMAEHAHGLENWDWNRYMDFANAEWKDNFAPTFPVPHKIYAEEGAPLSYTVPTYDFEGDAVTVSVLDKPSWMSLVGGVLGGTPPSAGSDTVTLRVADATGSRDRVFPVTISATGNDAPVIMSTPDFGIIELDSYNYLIAAEDVDGDPLTIDVPVKPAWMVFSGGNLLTGVPQTNDLGVSPVEITVHDGSVTVTQRFALVVFETPQMANLFLNGSFENGSTDWVLGDNAQVSSANQQHGGSSLAVTGVSSVTRQNVAVEAGTTYNLSVWVNSDSLTGGKTIFDTQDVYDDTCQFIIKPSSSGWTEYTGSFTATATGDVTFRMFAADSATAGTTYFDNLVLTEKPNAVPAFVSVPVTNLVVDVPYSYTLAAVDAEDDPLTYSGSVVPSGLTLAGNVLSGTISAVGDYPVKLTVSDGARSSDQVFTIAVGTAPSNGYDAWAAANRVDAGDVINLLEYALDGDTAVYGDGEPTAVKNGNALEYSFKQRNDDTNLVYTVEVCTDLTNPVWSDAGTTGVNTGTVGAYDSITHTIPADQAQSYIRLRVTNQ